MHKRDREIFIEKYKQHIAKRLRKGNTHSLFYIVVACIAIAFFLKITPLRGTLWDDGTDTPPPPTKNSNIILAYDDYPDTSKSNSNNPSIEIITESPQTDQPANSETEDMSQADAITVTTTLAKKDDIVFKTGNIKRDETLWSILKKHNIDTSIIPDLLSTAKGKYNFNRLPIERPYKITLVNNIFKELTIEPDDENILRVEKNDDKFKLSFTPILYDVKVESVSGKIERSLFETISDAGESSYITSSLSDIFGWQIDFHLDIQKGDEFKVIFEKKYRDNKFVKYGKIIGAEFKNSGKNHVAILFEDASGREGYYTLNGESLRKEFLKSPLKYTRISSGFTLSRYHPILKRYLPHLGIDYAAPFGTPVRAIGDGKVLWAGAKGPNGNLVMIKHNSIYTTSYAHLANYAKGIKNGTYVNQGDIIGYVGSTGRSTGPHLDFHIKKHGRDINPLSLKIPSASSVSNKDRQRFEARKNDIIKRLGSIERIV